MSTEFRQGAPDAEVWLRELSEQIEERARPMFHWFGLAREDAEDLLQQTWLIFLRKQDEIRNPEAWVLATLRRQCIMFLRKRQLDLGRRVDEAVLDLVAGKRDPDSELRCDLERALPGIPERCKAVLRLRYLEGLDPSEAAAQLGYKRSGIYKVVERCLDAFSRQLTNLGYSRG